ncbi:MAG TPA: DegT/DnrJ/EryC1/StrS family aminotransferase [Dehalococcoidia bacterium]|nr:DegT/DnrJ/EryC1/StrS family aminotransferase [Dehalococcoidia bacterium]
MIPVFKPALDEEEWHALREPLANGWLGLGPKTKEFERQFAAYTEAPHAVGTNSGTSALHLGFAVLDIAGGEVITTSLTYIATNHAILYCGGIPVFADIEPDTCNIAVDEIERCITPRTKAICVVHYAGHPCDMDPILELGARHGIPVLQDSAHACGSRYKGRMIGSFGPINTFSFDPVKNLATGAGGMVTLQDEGMDRRMRKLRWLGHSRPPGTPAEPGQMDYYHETEEVGWRHHMNDLSAAIGIVQLRKLEKHNGRRRELAAAYDREFASLDWLQTPVLRDYAFTAQHKYVVRVPEEDRDALILHLKSRDVGSHVHFVPSHLHPAYAPYRSELLPVTERVWKTLVTLPLFPTMTDDEFAQVVEAVKSYPKKASAAPGSVAARA